MKSGYQNYPFHNYETLAQYAPEHHTGGTWERVKCKTEISCVITGKLTEYDLWGTVEFTANKTRDTEEYYDIEITDRKALLSTDDDGEETFVINDEVTDQQIAAVIERIQHNLVIEEI